MDMLDAFTRLADNINGKLDQEIKVEDIMNSELGGIMDYGLWKESIELQKKFNDSVAPGWEQDKDQKKYDYWMAILDETVEVMNSRHWKWWKDSTKHGDVDWANIEVELVDLFHFIMSLCIQHNLTEVLFSQMINLQMNKDNLTLIKDDKYFDDFWQNFLMAVQMKNIPLMAIGWVEFWFRIGLDSKDLFMKYRIKASLNNIRQEFGYGAANAYSKIWVAPDGSKVEDNVMANILAEDVPLDKNTIENITTKLRNYYLENVAI